SRAVTDARGGLGHVLRRGLAMPLRVPDLRGEVQPVADVVGTVEVDKTRVRALIGARDLAIDAVSRSRDRREGRLGQRVTLNEITCARNRDHVTTVRAGRRARPLRIPDQAIDGT